MERLSVKRFELGERIVGVGVALKVGDEPFRPMALDYRLRALFELRRHRQVRPIIFRRVTGVVAINAAADGDFAIAVGTGEVQAQADFINPRGELIA